ncbi:MAG: N-acyl homoserine lactonase family protein [Deltaproteobacteria bacterium]|nr:N-acyl homoserine lactonase family protein [Deltaproteobacteria bacterium]
MDMKLYVLTSGVMWVERGFLWHFGSNEDSGKDYEARPFKVQKTHFYIDHPDAKIMVDLGFDAEMWGKKPSGFPGRTGPEGIQFHQAPDENPKAQLEKIGASIDDIDYVVMSHLMEEHAGFLPLFENKKARIVVQRKELEYALVNSRWNSAPEPFHSWMYHREMFDLPGLNYQLIEGDYTLLKGVEILHMPGHTPGYQMVKVDLKAQLPPGARHRKGRKRPDFLRTRL